MQDRNDFANFFRLEAGPLKRFLRHFAPKGAAEEIAQESFSRLLAAKGEIESMRGYLYATARHLAQAEWRRVFRGPAALDADLGDIEPASEAPDPEQALIEAEDYAAALAGLEALPDNLRTALYLHRVDRLTHDEVAERLGISPRTAQRYIKEAIARCRRAVRGDLDE